jgi:hypothetical protein
VNEDTGLVEEFLSPPEMPLGTMGILAHSSRVTQGTGWVICRSLGQEQRHLRRLEALVARSLASAGFPVLRIRANPAPEQEARATLSLSERVAELSAATHLLEQRTGVERVGVAGALFGGTIAALVAQEQHLPLLALWEPVVRGRAYIRNAFRLQRLSELTGMTAGAASEKQALEELESHGQTTIRGYVVTRESYDRASRVDLRQDLTSFAGRVLLISVSSTQSPATTLAQLDDHLRELGADSQLRTLTDSLETPFGEYYYRDVGVHRADVRLELDTAIAEETLAWALETEEARALA